MRSSGALTIPIATDTESAAAACSVSSLPIDASVTELKPIGAAARGDDDGRGDAREAEADRNQHPGHETGRHAEQCRM